jgi:hypothetical protein
MLRKVLVVEKDARIGGRTRISGVLPCEAIVAVVGSASLALKGCVKMRLMAVEAVSDIMLLALEIVRKRRSPGREACRKG